ncbi:MAG TPA: F0F1 ATP synthase subunit B [Candidatus Sulfotelmatobacter sp.]|nr:F0F1 ATP synthase subunit B [Candidatus Sulfotelmatobacter sp.]
MNALILLTGAEPEGQVQQIANTFGVDWPHLLAQIISFGIVCFLLHRFAYKPVLRMLEQRRQQIAEGIAEREKIKSELEQTEAERRRIIVQADEKAIQIVDEAHAAAERMMEKEIQKADAVAEQIIAKAREAALQEHNRMLEELKREIGILVIQATSRVTRKILTPEDQKRLAEETVGQLVRVA